MYALMLETDDCYRMRRLLCVSESFEALERYLHTLPNMKVHKNIPPEICRGTTYYRGDFRGCELALIEKVQQI